MKAYIETVNGACGIGVACEFGYGRDISTRVNPGGTGYVCAGFRSKYKEDMEMFATMEKRGPCVFKTPVKKNVNSGNDFFFAVFDWTADKKFGYEAQDKEEYGEDDDDF